MYIKHYETCKSTQDLLLEEDLYKCYPAIISSDYIENAKGRRDRKWDVFKNALACSFTLTKNSVLTLSALEVAVLVREFFFKEYEIDLKLKWPNDLYDKNIKKCGGILINSSKDHLIVGLGMNLEPNNKYGSVFFKSSPINGRDIAPKLYYYIITNRKRSSEVISSWNQNCFHLNQEVMIEEDSLETKGTFLGIGKMGQALVKVGQVTKEFYSATLHPLP